MNLVLDSDGITIHDPGCRMATDAEHWAWADDKQLAQVWSRVHSRHMKPCWACLPLKVDEHSEAAEGTS